MNWYKKRRYKKLRQKVASFKEYEISTSCSLFGEPYGYEMTVTATDYNHALIRFFRKYRRKYKECCPDSFGTDIQTTSNWGKFKVQDVKSGYKTYWR